MLQIEGDYEIKTEFLVDAQGAGGQGPSFTMVGPWYCFAVVLVVGAGRRWSWMIRNVQWAENQGFPKKNMFVVYVVVWFLIS